MWRYIVQKLSWMIVVVSSVAVIISIIMFPMPSDPAAIALGSTVTQAGIDNWWEMNGLNDSYFVQLGRYLSDMFLYLDLGVSYAYKVSVIQEFAKRIPRTLILGLITVLMDVLIGIPLGVTAAMHQNRFLDRVLMVVVMIGVSLLDLWLALVLIILFFSELGWLPVMGIEGVQYWTMPVIPAAVAGIAMNVRQARSAVPETKRADFITTARARGLREAIVIYEHLIPSALISAINNLETQFAVVIAGTVVIESVFSLLGVGLYLLSGISARNYPVIRGCVLILAVFALLIVLIADLIYAFIDPRAKVQYANTAAKKGRVE